MRVVATRVVAIGCLSRRIASKPKLGERGESDLECMFLCHSTS